MPLVNIHMKAGHSAEYRQTVLDCVHTGLVEALGIQDWDRFQRITEYPEGAFEAPPEKSGHFMIVELTLFPGRDREQKRSAIQRITGLLCERLTIAPTDVFIVIQEPPLENWGMGGRQKG